MKSRKLDGVRKSEIVQSADSAGAKVALSAVPSQLKNSLEINLPAELRDRLWFEPDLDHGLERCEDAIVAMAGNELSGPAQRLRGSLLARVAVDLERHLDEQVRFEELLEQLDPWLEPRGYEIGETLALRGEIQDGLQLIVSGQASVHDADGARLYQCGPGDVIEPWSAFSEHTASATVIANDGCHTMMLTSSARAILETDDNELTLRLFAFLVGRKPPSALGLDPD